MERLLQRRELIQEVSIRELIVAGSFSFTIMGIFSGVPLYICFSPWPDMGDPDTRFVRRIFFLPFSFLFGFIFIRVTQEIYVNVYIKVSRLINYMRSRRHYSIEEEEDQEEEDQEKEEEEEGGCPICLEDLERGLGCGVVRLPDCLHRFHRDCVDRWLLVRPCCPTCRRLVAVANN